MCRSEAFLLALAAALFAGGLAQAAETMDYGLGQPATAEQVAGWDIDVRPDGAGLPPGEGSVDDGEGVYEANCAACHGSFGESNEYMAIAGGVGSLASDAPVRTVGSKLNYATTLFDYINRAMPFPHSKALSANEVYAVSAYVLNLNDIVPADFVANRETLVKVEMPNRNGFVPFPGLSEVRGKPDTANTACMRDCEKEVTVSGSLPPGFVSSMYGEIGDEFRGLAVMNRRAPSAAMLPEGAAAAAASPHDLIQKYACTACHDVSRSGIGPAYRSVAERYRGDADALAKLTAKVRAGGSGNWGTVPMPPQSGPSDSELETILHWVLAGAPEP